MEVLQFLQSCHNHHCGRNLNVSFWTIRVKKIIIIIKGYEDSIQLIVYWVHSWHLLNTYLVFTKYTRYSQVMYHGSPDIYKVLKRFVPDTYRICTVEVLGTYRIGTGCTRYVMAIHL